MEWDSLLEMWKLEADWKLNLCHQLRDVKVSESSSVHLSISGDQDADESFADGRILHVGEELRGCTTGSQ